MIKKASPPPSTLLSGLGSWALPGAAIGAAGMGAANLASPEDPITHKKKSLLKSMLLGGALGGTIGGGARAAVDWWNPAVASDPGSAWATLTSKPEAPINPPNPIIGALGWQPAATTIGGATLGSAVGKARAIEAGSKAKTFDTDFKVPSGAGKAQEAAHEAEKLRLLKIRDGKGGIWGMGVGGLLGAATGFGSQNFLRNKATYDDNNNLPGLIDIISKNQQQ